MSPQDAHYVWYTLPSFSQRDGSVKILALASRYLERTVSGIHINIL